MNLLIITRKVDQQDDRTSFFVDWILEFAKHIDKLFIICQELGDTTGLPQNVEIYSLGKEKGKNKIKQLFLLIYHLIALLPKTNGVFSHMMPIYALLAGPWCKIYKKKLVQWYTHKKVSPTLYTTSLFVDEYITASPASFRMKTNKPVHIWGHGININKFKINNTPHNKFIILSVGRISPVKNIDLLIEAIKNIKLNEPELRNNLLTQIIGSPGLPSQNNYYLDLIKYSSTNELNSLINFLGPLPQNEIIQYYQNCDLFINLSETGSIDKVVLEAMACGKIILTSNEAFKSILPSKLYLEKNEANLIVKKIKEVYRLDKNTQIELGNQMRNIVEKKHNLENLIKKIIELYEKN